MGKYFDFTPVKPWASGLGDIFAGANAGLEYRDKRRAQDAEIAQKKASTDAFVEQVKAQNRKIELDEKRARFKFRQEQTDRNAATAAKVIDKAASGSVGAAQAQAAASQGVDPVTGQHYGVTFKPEDAGPAPEAPVAPEAPEMLPTRQGPDLTGIASMFLGMGGGDREALTQNPEQARAKTMAKVLGTQPAAPGSGEELFAKAAGEEAYGSAQRAQHERGQSADNQLQNDINQSTYARQKGDYDVQNAAYEPTKAAYDQKVAHPKFTIGVNGKQVEYDPGEQRTAKIQESKDTAARLRDQASKMPTDTEEGQKLVQRMLVTAASIEASVAPAAAAAVNTAASEGQAQAAKGVIVDKTLASQERTGAGHDAARRDAAKSHAGGAAAGMDVLARMMEGAVGPNGEITDPNILSKIQAEAQRLHIQPGGKNGYLGVIKEVTRGNAVASRTGRANAALEATDAQGNPLGAYTSPKAAAEGQKAESAYGRVRERVQALLDDVKEFGPRVTDKDAIQRRTNRALEAQAALRVFNGFGSTDFSQKLEHDLQGASGTPDGLMNFLMGANPETFGHILDDAWKYQEGSRRVRLRGGSGPAAGKGPTPQSIAGGARGQKGPAAEPRRVKLKSGQMGTLDPDGTFHPDGG